MNQLVCPLCCETLKEEGAHFYKHFKYKRYACGESTCDMGFYTQQELNAHCSKHGHKRSFQKTVNPYIDKMISVVVEDAYALATDDMETVLEKRWGRDPRSVSPTSPVKKTPTDSAKNKRSSVVTPTSPPVPKKAKSGTSTTSPFAFLNRRTNNSESSLCPNASSTSAQPASSSSAQAIVDSTTSEHNISIDKTKKPRKKRNESMTAAQNQEKAGKNANYDEMSAIDKLIGWFDPNVPERRDAAKVKCAVCNEEIVYDFILRKGHVTRSHMAADVAPEDYDDLLKTAMDRSYPDLPNSDLACQLCMTGAEVRKNMRREHIEKLHTTSLPPLTCPVGECEKGFRRQCDLSSHMKDTHKASMAVYKNATFQQVRRRRNAMINEMINKCFPWSRLEAIENKTVVGEKSDSVNRAPVDRSFDTDVRVRDVNKTRRAPQYNANRSSSSDSDSEHEEAASVATGEVSETGGTDDFPQDVIYICHQFNTEVAQKLSQIVRIKPEIIDVEDVLMNDVTMEINEIPVKEETEEEQPKEENNSTLPSIPIPSIFSPYEPIVPPPATSPDPMNPPIASLLPTRILSATNVLENKYNENVSSRRSTSRERSSNRNYDERWSRNDYSNPRNYSNRSFHQRNQRGHSSSNRFNSPFVSRNNYNNNSETTEGSSRRSEYNSSSSNHHSRSSYRGNRDDRGSRW
ncbi:C2H2-type domain-containing protein [Caenorhabditis elegans]|uniref:C2H2-type domain-containing protein n=1 Tax=Caenorhabditis elegans TaxID=6239 RepID=Q9GYG1_CAEEL|nr:C2H2-type domain-containing protein [Caenorhabditis elegans]CCD66666.1 C2H2-type domain-containing protein [Caenorhabditis elegans]|eukprot:NP_498124.2 Zinc finger putative Transcription Factor family [Caenorhabditis elegans]